MTSLSAPASFKSATPEERAKVCNGCGSAKAKFDFVPDTAWGMSITASCDIHDWQYNYGRTIEDKEEADREYRNNMLRQADEACFTKGGGFFQRWLKRRRYARINFYYISVKNFGGPSFWAGKEGNP